MRINPKIYRWIAGSQFTTRENDLNNLSWWWWCVFVSHSSDIDECKEGNFSCLPNTKCKNIDGSYTCKCKTGFKYNKKNKTCDGEWPLWVFKVCQVADINKQCIYYLGGLKMATCVSFTTRQYQAKENSLDFGSLSWYLLSFPHQFCHLSPIKMKRLVQPSNFEAVSWKNYLALCVCFSARERERVSVSVFVCACVRASARVRYRGGVSD